MVDYSKWQNLDISDDSDTENRTPTMMTDEQVASLAAEVDQKNGGTGEFIRMTENLTVEANFIRIDPKDNMLGIPSKMFCHPGRLVRQPDPEFPFCFSKGYIDRWGAFHDCDKLMERQMLTQYIYNSDNPSPETQFVEYLRQKKKEELQNSLPGAEPLFSKVLVLKVEMAYIQPLVWRRFKVCGGVTLNVFQDKILSPIMGWVRHYHAYHFTDVRDGAEFGPEQSTAIDMMHKLRHGHLWIDDSTIRIAQLLQQPGDVMLYTYDLGDFWLHKIVLEEVQEPLGEGQSTCALLDGAMSCPPEDSNGFEGMGNRKYQANFLDTYFEAKGEAVRQGEDQVDGMGVKALKEFLRGRGVNPAGLLEKQDLVRCAKELVRRRGPTVAAGGKQAEAARAVREAQVSANWEAMGTTGPEDFSVAAYGARLLKAIRSPQSVPFGQKTNMSSFMGFGGGTTGEMPEEIRMQMMFGAGADKLKKSMKVVDGFFDSTMSEIIAGRDTEATALCARCFAPSKIGFCALCREAAYCSLRCQELDWKERHKDECKGKDKTKKRSKAKKKKKKKKKEENVVKNTGVQQHRTEEQDSESLPGQQQSGSEKNGGADLCPNGNNAATAADYDDDDKQFHEQYGDNNEEKKEDDDKGGNNINIEAFSTKLAPKYGSLECDDNKDEDVLDAAWDDLNGG